MDVGFSTTERTTGLAWRVAGRIEVALAATPWETRWAMLPEGVTFDLAALDGPILPGAPGTAARACEAVFNRRPFWNRCKPGLSHHGRGVDLRRAGATAAAQIAAVLGKTAFLSGPEVLAGVPIVEAFPNAFLGVMLPAEIYAARKPARRKKSDWLYERARGLT
jgi:hypothetical protein